MILKKISILILIGLCSLFAENKTKRITFEHTQGKSPFQYASLGKMVWFSDSNDYLAIGKGNYLNSIVKISFLDNDTSILIDSSLLNYKNKKISIDDMKLDSKGKKILISSNEEKIWRHSFFATYFVVDIESKQVLPVSSNNKRLRNVKFSPDGKFVAYVREDNNLYTFDLTRKKQRRISFSGSKTISNGHFEWVYEEEFGSYDAYLWSPDSKNIAYWEEDQSNVPIFKLFSEVSLYPQVKELHYPKAGQQNPSMSIFVSKTKGGGSKRLFSGHQKDIYLPWMKWINNQEIVFMEMDRLQKKWQFIHTNIKKIKLSRGLSESDMSGWVDLHRNYFFLKNEDVLWLSEQDGWRHIYLHSKNGKKIRQITKGNWEVKNIIHFDEISKKIYFISNKESVFENRFYSIDFDGNNLKLLTSEEGSHSIKVLPEKNMFIDSFSSLREPTKHLLKKMNGELIKVLSETDKSQFNAYDWSFPEIIQFESEDKSVKLDGIITYPPDFSKNKRYPLIVYGYGMPGTQIVYNRWGSLWNQYLAQQGYIVFSMDARGMSGRGEKFKNLSYGNMSKYLSIDTAAGVKHLINKGFVHEDKIGAWGWSGGGYFTGLMLTKNAELFDVGVSVAPVMDFRLYDSIYTERSMGLPQNNEAGYDSTSVLSYVDRFKGKLLVIHGTGDDNVHSQNLTWLIEEFVKNDKQLDVFYYPDRPHSMRGGNARKNLYKKMVNYFNDHLK